MLQGKIALVTGATKGIGFATAKELARRGATVIVCSRSSTSARNAAALVGKSAYHKKLDITNPRNVLATVKQIIQDHGRIDILVNNAGYPFEPRVWYKKMHQVQDEELEAVLEVDLKGTFRITRAILPEMAKHGGVIINISSTPAIAGLTEGAPYSLAKAGLVAMTKHVALEYGVDNIRAYTLALGNIATDATYNSMTEKARKTAAKESTMKRWGRPDEVACVIASLASEDFSFATGNTIVVDGGTVFL